LTTQRKRFEAIVSLWGRKKEGKGGEKGGKKMRKRKKRGGREQGINYGDKM
jgi:hypothetical protein